MTNIFMIGLLALIFLAGLYVLLSAAKLSVMFFGLGFVAAVIFNLTIFKKKKK